MVVIPYMDDTLVVVSSSETVYMITEVKETEQERAVEENEPPRPLQVRTEDSDSDEKEGVVVPQSTSPVSPIDLDLSDAARQLIDEVANFYNHNRVTTQNATVEEAFLYAQRTGTTSYVIDTTKRCTVGTAKVGERFQFLGRVSSGKIVDAIIEMITFHLRI